MSIEKENDINVDDINEKEEGQEIDETNENEEKDIDTSKEQETQEEQFKEKYLRLLADYENLKRRSALEKLQEHQMTKVEVFKELVDVIDNFERSMSFDASTEEFKKGIELVHEQLVNKLEKLGLEKVLEEGKMDPNYHQAVMTDTVDELEDDEIIEVLQSGYKIEDKLIRAAMIKVNKKQ